MAKEPLPIQDDPAAGESRPVPAKRLLLVDDSESNRVTLELLLQDAGYLVDAAASFQQAEQRLASECARYDLVILDEHLGDGLGSDLAAVVRKVQPQARRLLFSITMTPAERRLAADKVEAVVEKDVDFSELLAVIQRLLN